MASIQLPSYQLNAISEIARRRLIERGKTESFRRFVERVRPGFIWYRHCEIIASAAERVASGEIKRLMIFVPPRHSKSETISRLFTAYYLRKNPDKWVGLTSYSADLAYVLSRAAQDNYLAAGGTLNDKAGAVKHWETGKGGGLWAAGVGGPITGKGYDCFTGDTRVATSEGEIKIADLYQSRRRFMVLSYCHERNELEWNYINRKRKQRVTGLVEIQFQSGRSFYCTPAHLVYSCERGYRPAGDLVPGEAVIQIPQIQDVRGVPVGNLSDGSLQYLLSGNQEELLRDDVCLLRTGVSAGTVSSHQGGGAGVSSGLLQQGMQPESPRDQASPDLSAMRSSNRDETVKILPAMPPHQAAMHGQNPAGTMRLLPRNVSASISPARVLWSGLPEYGTLNQNAGIGQQSLQDRDELRGLVPAHAPCDPRPGWPPVRSVRGGECADDVSAAGQNSSALPSGDSPHRPLPQQQPSAKSNNALRLLPWTASQDGRRWQSDTVSAVISYGDRSEFVYDIEVEGNRNFFANGILVHNCGIIDDPLKNAEEASSEIIRAKQKEWYSSTFYTRAEPGAAIILIQTRWHGDDLSGWLLDQESESPEYWHIVNLPALAEDPAIFPATCTVEADWREPGAALCPERYDAGRLQAIQSRIGGYFFDALYQQRPSAKEGEFFKVTHLEIEDAPPAGLRICRAWDLAASSGGGDYTAGIKIGAASDGKFYIVDVRRGQWSPDERDAVMRQAAQLDTNAVKIRLAQDPGQAGVDQAQRLTRMLAGYNVRSERVTGDKATRAAGFAAQVNAGNVRMIRGQWNESFLEELRQFPQGRNDDQVDAAADAFNELTLGSQYAQGKLLR